MQTQVHIEHSLDAVYPQWDEHTCYGASEVFPEFASVSENTVLSEGNKVYEMVRNTIAALDLDKDHFGTEAWNPFATFIAQGDTVLIKPNMVRHFNGAEHGGMDCLVTHPSIVRAIIDYTALALKGTGRIFLADAPVQGCDFGMLVKKLHYDKIVEYFQKQGISVILMDLRQLEDVYKGSAEKEACFTAGNEDVVVDLGEDSAFNNPKMADSSAFPKQDRADIPPRELRITNYLPEHMEVYHQGNVHSYSVAKAVMEADVIINLPKPKTHRKAGMTASLKNMVGCVAKKECLPHHTKGSTQEHGDEYLKSSVFKKWQTGLNEKRDRLTAAGKKIPGWYGILGVILYKTARMCRADAYTEGSWYGNDTLWRTICDICRIILYADKHGKMSQECQRKMFILADMIVAGEGEGPLCPLPRQTGVLVGGWEQIAVDETIAALMGFSSECFPSIANAEFGIHYKLPHKDMTISSNHPAFRGKTTQEIKKESTPFVPTYGWAKRLKA